MLPEFMGVGQLTAGLSRHLERQQVAGHVLIHDREVVLLVARRLDEVVLLVEVE